MNQLVGSRPVAVRGKNIAKNVSKNVSGKYSQNFLIMLKILQQIHLKLLQKE